MTPANLGKRFQYSGNSLSVNVRAAGTGRGGARNFAERQSLSIKPSTADNLRQAARFASSIGLPLNRHMTINLEQLGIEDHTATEAISSFMKSLREWLKRQGCNTASIWARENSGHTGSHWHLLFHLPPGVQLYKRHLSILKRMTGRRYKTGSVMTRSVRGATGDNGSALYLSNIERVVAYALKGEMKNLSGAAERPRCSQGAIIGKRAGTSQNIGKAARQVAGWTARNLTRTTRLGVEMSGTSEGQISAPDRLYAGSSERMPLGSDVHLQDAMDAPDGNQPEMDGHGPVADSATKPAKTC